MGLRARCASRSWIHRRIGAFLDRLIIFVDTFLDYLAREEAREIQLCKAPPATRGGYVKLPDYRLPHEWNKTMLDPFLVFGISGQIPGEEAFLVKEPPNQKWHHDGDRDEPPV